MTSVSVQYVICVFFALNLSVSGCQIWVVICHFWVLRRQKRRRIIASRNTEPIEEGFAMENELRVLITELLGAVADADLLDLVYKMLLNSITES